MQDDASYEYLAHVRKAIADDERRIAVIGEQIESLEAQRIKFQNDITEWRQIESLIVAKVTSLIAAQEEESSAGVEGMNEGGTPSLDTVQSKHADNGRDYTPSAVRSKREEGVPEEERYDFKGMTHEKAAEIALKRIGRPATAAEIRDVLLELGCEIHQNPKYASNIIYNSIGRAKTKYHKLSGGRWKLIEEGQEDLIGKDEGSIASPRDEGSTRIIEMARQILNEEHNKFMSSPEIARAASKRDAEFGGDIKSYSYLFKEAMKEHPDFERQGTFYRLTNPIDTPDPDNQ